MSALYSLPVTVVTHSMAASDTGILRLLRSSCSRWFSSLMRRSLSAAIGAFLGLLVVSLKPSFMREGGCLRVLANGPPIAISAHPNPDKAMLGNKCSPLRNRDR